MSGRRGDGDSVATSTAARILPRKTGKAWSGRGDSSARRRRTPRAKLPEVAVRIRIFLLVAALLLGASGDVQPAGGRPPVKTLTFAVGGAPSELDYWEELLREFTARTGIRVELLRQPTDTGLRRQMLTVPLQARVPSPDVFLMDVAWLAQFAASGWLEPLSPIWEGGVAEGRLLPPDDRDGRHVRGTSPCPCTWTGGCCITGRTCWRNTDCRGLPAPGTSFSGIP